MGKEIENIRMEYDEEDIFYINGLASCAMRDCSNNLRHSKNYLGAAKMGKSSRTNRSLR